MVRDPAELAYPHTACSQMKRAFLNLRVYSKVLAPSNTCLLARPRTWQLTFSFFFSFFKCAADSLKSRENPSQEFPPNTTTY